MALACQSRWKQHLATRRDLKHLISYAEAMTVLPAQLVHDRDYELRPHRDHPPERMRYDVIWRAGVITHPSRRCGTPDQLMCFACAPVLQRLSHIDTFSACLAKPPSINSSFHVDMAAPPKHSIDETHGKEGITQVFLANLAALASAGVAIRAPYAGSIGCIVLAAVSTGLGGIVLYVLATLQVIECDEMKQLGRERGKEVACFALCPCDLPQVIRQYTFYTCSPSAVDHEALNHGGICRGFFN